MLNRTSREITSLGAAAPCDEHIVLWRLQGAEHELVCSTVITSFGFALHLALAGQPILLELQRSLDRVTDKAARLEAWLLEQGWTATATATD